MQRHTQSNQSGFVSIMVTMIIMTVLTLILLGFVRLMQREKSLALDRQLSTQAYYAAESGINDASEYLKTNPSYTNNNCAIAVPGFSNNLGNGLSYTCVLINPSPANLRYDDIGQENPQVIRLQPTAGIINRIQISWRDSGASNTFQGTPSGTFPLSQRGSPPANDLASRTGMLRVAVTPEGGGPLTGDGLLSRSKSFFLYPHNGPAQPNPDTGYTAQSFVAPDADGRLVQVDCNVNSLPHYCKAEISGLAVAGNIYLQVVSLYRNARVEIRAKTAANTPIVLTGEQIEIDATGKANDVLRRVQVRRPVRNDYYMPNAALKTMGPICKRWAVWPGGISNDITAVTNPCHTNAPIN